jgi:hypothetical protein
VAPVSEAIGIHCVGPHFENEPWKPGRTLELKRKIGKELFGAAEGLLCGFGLRRPFLISPTGYVLLRVVAEHANHFGVGFHSKMLGKPNAVVDWHLLPLELRVRLDASQKAFNGAGCTTWASTLTHWYVFLSIQSFPFMPVSTLASRFGGT